MNKKYTRNELTSPLDKLVKLIECDNPKKINKNTIKVELEKLQDVDLLVLCKKELFFQNAKGGTMETIYPVCDEAAVFIACLIDKPIMSS